MAATEFRETVEQVQAALSAFIAGNPEPFKVCWSHGDDVTIFGGWGAFERGWNHVGPRLDWAAARFSGGEQSYQQLALEIGGDLAFTVGIEHGDVRLAGQGAFSPMTSRVTHIYRREGGVWRLIHRHADPIPPQADMTAVLQ